MGKKVHPYITASKRRQTTAGNLAFKMKVMPLRTLLRRYGGLQRPKIEPYQVLDEKKELVKWESLPNNATIIYVSAEWAGNDHQDPNGVRVRTLCRVLGRLSRGEIDRVDMDPTHAIMYKQNVTTTADEWVEVMSNTFLWFDWFCAPQPSVETDPDRRKRLEELRKRAKMSMTAYVERADIFLILAPGCRHVDRIDARTKKRQALCYRTWRQQGRCVTDLFASFLSRDKSYPTLLVCSAEGQPMWISSVEALKLCVGTCTFDCCSQHRPAGSNVEACSSRIEEEETKCATRRTLAKGVPVKCVDCEKDIVRRDLEQLIMKKANHLFESDMVAQGRLVLCLQRWWLRDLPRCTREKEDEDATERLDTVLQSTNLEAFKSYLRWDDALDGSLYDRVDVSLLYYSAIYGCGDSLVRTILKRTEAHHIDQPRKDYMDWACPSKGYVSLGVPGKTTALHAAMAFGNPKAVRALLNGGADPYSSTRYGYDAFHYAALYGRVDNMDMWMSVLSSWDLERRSVRTGDTYMNVTAIFGPYKRCTIQWLLDHGARDDVLSRSGKSNLTIACTNEDADPDAVQLLLDRLETRRRQNGIDGLDTPGDICYGTKSQNMKWKAIRGGAKVLYRTRLSKSTLVKRLAGGVGMTALHYAARRGDLRMVEMLLQAGADPTLKNGLDEDVFASCRAFPEIRGALRRRDRKRAWKQKHKDADTSTTIKLLTTRSSGITRRHTTATPLLYDMWLMSASRFMALYGRGGMVKTVESHQDLKARGDVITFDQLPLDAHIIFVSHEWLAWHHPDPDGIQTRTLCRILERIGTGEISQIDMDPFHELIYKQKYSTSSEDLRDMFSNVYLWLDWSSMPQPSAQPDLEETEKDALKQAGGRAIRSIPAYIERCDFMMIVAPSGTHANRVDKSTEAPIHTCYRTWRRRGWCVLEFAASYFSRDKTNPALLVRSAEGTPEWISPMEIQKLAVGLCDFSCCDRNHVLTTATQEATSDGQSKGDPIPCDKPIVRSIMMQMMRAKVSHLFAKGDNVLGRLYFSMRHWSLRGLDYNDGAVGDGGIRTMGGEGDEKRDVLDDSLDAVVNSTSTNATLQDVCVDDDTDMLMRVFLKSLRWDRVVSTIHGGDRDTNIDTNTLEWFDEGGVSLLMYAVLQNNVRVVKQLLAILAETTKTDTELRRHRLNSRVGKDGLVEVGIPGESTCLHVAMFFASPDVVRLLLDFGADPTSEDSNGVDSLMFSSISGSFANTRYWLSRFSSWDLSRRNTAFGATALHCALFVGPNKMETVKLLVEASAPLIGVFNHGGTSIIHNATNNIDADPAVVRYVLNTVKTLVGDDKTKLSKIVNYRRRAQTTWWRFLRVLSIVLTKSGLSRSGLFRDLAFDSGAPPLLEAVRSGDLDIVKILLEYGADPSIRNTIGMDALATCVAYGPYPSIEHELREHSGRLRK